MPRKSKPDDQFVQQAGFALRRVVVTRRARQSSPFGDRIAQRRYSLGKTQADVARAIGIQRTSLVNIESGYQLVSLPVFLRLCHELRTTPNVLLNFKTREPRAK